MSLHFVFNNGKQHKCKYRGTIRLGDSDHYFPEGCDTRIRIFLILKQETLPKFWTDNAQKKKGKRNGKIKNILAADEWHATNWNKPAECDKKIFQQPGKHFFLGSYCVTWKKKPCIPTSLGSSP